MIVVEKRLTDVFSQLPEIDGFKPIYKWGNEEHLIQQLTLFSKENKSIYPLIYQTSIGSNQDAIAKTAEVKPTFILACRNENVSLVNENRWAMSYENVLYPLVDNIEKCFHRAGIFMWDGKFRVDEYPNYKSITHKNKTIDIWDALTITFLNNVTINDRCINTIKF